MDKLWALVSITDRNDPPLFIGIFSTPLKAFEVLERDRIENPDQFKFHDICIRSRNESPFTLVETSDPRVWVIYGYPGHPTAYSDDDIEWEVGKIMLCERDLPVTIFW